MKTITGQIAFLAGGIIVLPFVPFLFWQGKRVRRRVGRLPDAAGEVAGQFGGSDTLLNLMAIGESTVAGVGAKTHDEALAGQLAKFLSLQTQKSVRWHAVGESGITAAGTLQRLLPQMPKTKMNVIIVALGGNDAFKASSPARFRRDMTMLAEKLRKHSPDAVILFANTPMIRDFPVLPQPLKFVLWRISRLHHAVMKSLAESMKGVFYFDEAGKAADGFFADGIHPSPLGYALWSEAMIKFLLKRTKI